MRLPRSESRLLLLLFLVSLAARLAAVGATLWMDVRPVNDEWGYRDRGQGWAEVYRDLAAGDAPAAEHWEQAYGDGFQPPLHPMVLGAVGATGLPVDLGGRLLNALLTALATPLVYRLARHGADRRAATAASVLHLLYPTFNFFAHMLWAEPLFVLLLLGAAERALAARDAAAGRRLGRSVAAGLCLGLACLTRTAGVSFLLALPLLFAGTGRVRAGRVRAAVLMIAVAAAVIAPWQAALHREEGRFALLATSSGLNLAMGNNPHVADGAGSTWTDPAANARLRADIDRHAAARDLSPDRAAASYAHAHMQADPAAALRRVGDRIRLVAAPDLFPVRQMLQMACRPVPTAVAGLHWLMHVAAWWGLLYLILRGLLSGAGGGRAGFLAALAAAGFLGPALTVGFSRLHLPMLALLLPVAGAAWANRREAIPLLRRGWLAAAMGLAIWLAVSGVAEQIEHQLWPTRLYRPLVDGVAGIVGAAPVYAEQVVVRLGDDGPERLDLAPNPHRRASLSRDGWRMVTMHVFASDPGEAGQLELSTPGGLTVRIDPVSRAYAWRWRDLASEGLPGVRVRWQGGIPPSPAE